MTRRLGDLAEHVGGRVVGAPDREIRGVRSLGEAGPGDLSLLTHSRYRGEAGDSAAGALLVAPGERGEDWLADTGRDLLVVDDPAWALARVLELLHPRPAADAGIHPTAVVAADATVAADAHVGPYAVIGAGSEVGSGAELHAHVVLGRRSKVGAGSVLHPHVVLYDDTEVGERVIVHSGVVLGADGFGYATRVEDGRPVHHKVPQVGRVVLGDDVEVGALSAVDRATLGETRVGSGTKIDNLVQVGHNVQVGRSCILCGQAGIAGSAKLGDAVVLAGQSGVAGHLSVGDGVQVAAKSALLQGTESGRKVAGIPAVDLSTWRRQSVALARMGGWGKKLKELERRLRRLEGDTEEDTR